MIVLRMNCRLTSTFSLVVVRRLCESAFLPGHVLHDGAGFLSFSSAYWLEQVVGLQLPSFVSCPA
jgi:hypothetical protein